MIACLGIGLSGCTKETSPLAILGDAPADSSLYGPSSGTLGMSENHRFDLFKLEPNGRVGIWRKVSRIKQPDPGKKITLMLHGFNLGDRSIAEKPTRWDVSKKFGFTDFSDKTRKERFVPASRNAGDIYALMWDSRAGNPWELENLLLGGTWSAPQLNKVGENQQLKNYMKSDPIDSETDTIFFKELYNFYQEISKDIKHSKINIAGFSKGGHVAIKLASKHDSLSLLTLETLTLLDIYVGPPWANGGLGQKLIKDIKMIKQKADILNIRSSEIYDLKLVNVPLSDKAFITQLKTETNEFWVLPNQTDKERYKSSPSLSPIPAVTKVVSDHLRAPQYFLLSSILCNPALPTIINPRIPPNTLSMSIINPEPVTEWIYSGPIQKP
jgi:hypothetical protein